MSDPCDLTAIAHWMERYEREKARADDEYERAEMFQRDARRSDAALVAERARAEKAEAALEAENLGAKAEQGRLADALAAANARAEKAEMTIQDMLAELRRAQEELDILAGDMAKVMAQLEAATERAEKAEAALATEKAKQAGWLANIEKMVILVRELREILDVRARGAKPPKTTPRDP